MKDKETEDLIALLDPNRDYGDRSYEEIVAGCRDGSIHIGPGTPTPILRHVGRGVSVKGTGAPLAVKNQGREKKAWVTIFEDRGANDVDAVYDALIASAVGGDVKAQQYYFDRMFGKPRESRDTQNESQLASFFASYAGTRMAQTEDYVPRESGTIIDMEAEDKE
tara:strand:+ start:2922 stop:3416 length:495 start_codon:yes stop_codon:yes gene_type:complete